MSFNDSLNQGIADFSLLHQIVHGDVNTSVPTEAGPIPSVAKTIVGISAKVVNALTAISSSSLTIGSGIQTIVIPTGKAYQPGQYVTIADSAGTDVMFGAVVSYTGTTLVVNVLDTLGSGTHSTWIVSLSGPIGKAGMDAYGLAVQNGFPGSMGDWLDSLKGAPGDPGADGAHGLNGADGKSAYQLAVEGGFQGTLQEWLASIKGKDGTSITIKDILTSQTDLPANANLGDAYVVAGDIWVYGQSGWFNAGQFLGVAGADGRSAYQIALDNGFVGDEAAWLESLKGAPGPRGLPGVPGTDGVDGVNGKSAYELAVQSGFNGTEAAWLNSLVGPKGADGKDGVDGVNGINGKSAYQVAVDSGFIGSEQAWLTSLKGAKGDQGVPGRDGLNGTNGINGADGRDGANGVDGKTVRYGSGAPASGLGVDGDFYIDVNAHFIYGPKAAGNWPAGVSIVGPQGQKGDPGVKGDTGAAGNDGAPGQKGDPGVQGVPGVDGKTIRYGSGAPAVGLGVAGDFYIDVTANFIYGPKTTVWPTGVSLVGPAGQKGDPGNAGAAGADGKTVRYGAGAPSNSLGVDGDFYIDTVAHAIYGPKATTWPSGTSLVGPQGQKGDPGSQGTPGIVPSLTVVASEALSAGDFVNLYSNGGTLNVRRANAATGLRAHGFVLSAVASGANASVNTIGVNIAVSGQTIGDVFLQTSPGQAGATVPSGSGQIVQNLGTALSATSINFESKLVITLA